MHKTHIAVVDEKSPLEIEACDALLTNSTGIALMIRHADCQAAIFYDPIHHALGVAHAGWRGSVANIYAHTIFKMREVFGTDPSDLLVGISPSLGPKRAEFIHYKKELPSSFWPFEVSENHFDFWAISRWQLVQAGVQSERIEIAERCTYLEPKEFFSHRRDRVSGRLGTFAVLT